MPKYLELAEPLTRLTKKNEPFQWESEQQCAFETMVTAVTTAPSLQHFDHEGQVIIQMDASDYVSARVLSQHDDNRAVHPVANNWEK